MRLIYRIKQAMLATGDLIAYCFGFYLAIWLRYLRLPNWEDIAKHLNIFIILFLTWVVINFVNGLYDLHQLKNKKTNRLFVEAGLISLLVSIILLYILPQRIISPKTILLLNIILGYSLSYLWRMVFNTFVNAKALQTNIIFVGATPETFELIKILQKNPERGYKISALIDAENSIKPADFPFFDVYHGLNKVRPAVTNHQAEQVVIAPHLKQNEEAMKELYELLFWNVKITDLSSFYEVITGRIPPATFSEAWFLDHLKSQEMPIYDKLKVGFDFLIGSLVGLFFILTFPLIALAIRLDSTGPIFYKQPRVGKNGKTFMLYKFRSMQSLTPDGGAETQGAEFAQKDDNRITRIGRLLRKTRLDEIPQFINLLKQDMSFIGPRPERPEIVAQLQLRMPYYSLRHIIKPGLTGWAAIQQHYTDNLESSLEKLQYDLYYIKNRSFALDLAVILRTINVVMRMMGQ